VALAAVVAAAAWLAPSPLRRLWDRVAGREPAPKKGPAAKK